MKGVPEGQSTVRRDVREGYGIMCNRRFHPGTMSECNALPHTPICPVRIAASDGVLKLIAPAFLRRVVLAVVRLASTTINRGSSTPEGAMTTSAGMSGTTSWSQLVSLIMLPHQGVVN
jgi:hypothetical protein